jgi:hypothetical protein
MLAANRNHSRYAQRVIDGKKYKKNSCRPVNENTLFASGISMTMTMTMAHLSVAPPLSHTDEFPPRLLVGSHCLHVLLS